MITLEQACELALKSFKEYHYENPGIKIIKEIDKRWIIDSYNKDDPDGVYFGPVPVIIDMETGELQSYIIHHNFKEYRKAKKIKIPKAYR